MTEVVIEPQLFVTSKPGEAITTCQDVGWFAPLGSPETGVAAFAVADGATGGWDGQRWAELLVDAAAAAVVADRATRRLDATWIESTFADHLDRAREAWVVDGPSADAEDPVGVLARTKFLSTGGHATLIVGVVDMSVSDVGSLSGFAVGDSLLVHLRRVDGVLRLLAATPLARSDEFDARPDLISSRPSRSGVVAPDVVSIDLADLRVDDCVLVMTDALAAWALRRHEHGRPVWDLLERLDNGRFGTMIERTRRAGEMVSDDVLLLRLRVCRSPLVRAVASAPTATGATSLPRGRS